MQVHSKRIIPKEFIIYVSFDDNIFKRTRIRKECDIDTRQLNFWTVCLWIFLDMNL